MFQLKRDQQFDEQYYLAEYPDVAKAVESGAIASAEMHYRKHGRREGRRPCAPPPLPPEKSPELPVTTSPVAFFIFNRPDLTRLSFERIASYQPHRLYLIADAARSDAERERVEATRAVVEQIDWPCEVARVYAEKNMGCKQRLVSGLQYVFERETQAIIVEDDVLAHPDFFEFCHTMLASVSRR